MNFRGKQIDPIKLWSNYCNIKEDDEGTFLNLVHCPNPNHLNSRSPAFQVNVRKPMVHCFSGCGISGSYEHAVCIIEGIYDKLKIDLADVSPEGKRRKSAAYREARKIIYRVSRSNEKVSLSPEFKRIGNPKEVSAKSIGQPRNDAEKDLGNYSYLPKDILAYLDERGITASSRARWQLGYDEDQERLTLPVFDNRNRLQFVIRRAIKEKQRPKYLYPLDSLKTACLYGACNLDLDLVESEGLVVVEGAIDCIKLHQYGFRNTVAILGSSLSKKQLYEIVRINPKRVYLFFDKDAAGVWALEKAAKSLSPRYQVKIPLYPKGKDLDPGKLTKKQIENAFASSVSILQIRKKLAKVRRQLATTQFS